MSSPKKSPRGVHLLNPKSDPVHVPSRKNTGQAPIGTPQQQRGVHLLSPKSDPVHVPSRKNTGQAPIGTPKQQRGVHLLNPKSDPVHVPSRRAPPKPIAPPPPPKGSRKGYMYTPFGGDQALDSALGENMALLQAGKKPRILLGPDHKTADHMEKLRQDRLTTLGNSLASSDRALAQIPGARRVLDQRMLATIRQSVEAPGATAADTREARRNAKEDHSFRNLNIDTIEVRAKANISMKRPQHEALEKTRIANTSPGIYPDLYEKPLQHLSPDTAYTKGDKLYVLGHGTPNKDRIYARNDGTGGSLDAKGLAAHLEKAGLPKDAMDLRLTACQGVPQVDDETDDPVKATKDSGFLVPELAKQMKGLGYQDLTVTGYQGNGVTFPFDSKSHLRSDPADDENRVKRSLAAIRYPTKKM